MVVAVDCPDVMLDKIRFCGVDLGLGIFDHSEMSTQRVKKQ
jgi:hypothetical protein